MSPSRVDHQALFSVLPSPYLVLDADLTVVEANDMYLRVTGRTREELIGRYLFDVYPDNPDDPAADGIRTLTASSNASCGPRNRTRSTCSGTTSRCPAAPAPSRNAGGRRSTRPSSAPTARSSGSSTASRT